MRSAQDLLAFMVSGEKSGVILIGLPLYVTWHFSLTAFNILSLFSTFLVVPQKTGHDTSVGPCYTTPGHIPRGFPGM